MIVVTCQSWWPLISTTCQTQCIILKKHGSNYPCSFYIDKIMAHRSFLHCFWTLSQNLLYCKSSTTTSITLTNFWIYVKLLKWCILSTMAFNGHMLIISKPFKTLWKVEVFLKANKTHWAKSSFFASFSLFVKVETSQYTQKIILNNLKQETYNGYNVWDVCGGSVIKSNPIFFVV